MRRKDRAVIMISQAPIFTIHAKLADIRHFGTTPYGERRVIDILGGRARGGRGVAGTGRDRRLRAA